MVIKTVCRFPSVQLSEAEQTDMWMHEKAQRRKEEEEEEDEDNDDKSNVKTKFLSMIV